MKLRKLVAGAVIAQGLALLGASAANADVTYTYTGNDFTAVIPDTGPYTTSDMVTASITLAAPLGASLDLFPVTPIAFTLSDGVQTITQSSVASSEFGFQEFEFSTDSSASITAWLIDVAVPVFFPKLGSSQDFICTQNAPTGRTGQICFVDSIIDRGLTDEGTDIGGQGLISGDPGVWTGPNQVPEPSTVSLLGAGLLGLVFLWRRRRQILGLVQ